jgi:tetratricopeptide (TPR) repeat protein
MHALVNHPYERLAVAAYDMSYFLAQVQPSEDLLDAMMDKLDVLKMSNMQGKCHKLKGYILTTLCHYDLAIQEIYEAKKHFNQIEDQLGVAQCLQSLGDILHMQAKYSEAQEKLEEAQKQFNQIGSQLGAAQCLRSLGDILRMQAKYSEAQEKLEEAQKQFNQIGDQTWCCSMSSKSW